MHISLCGLFNAKAIFVEEQLWYCLTHNWKDKGVYETDELPTALARHIKGGGYTFPKEY